METQFTPIASAVGGAMIGLSAVWLMASLGRIAGISGITSRLLPPNASGFSVGLPFIAGLLLAAPLYLAFSAQPIEHTVSSNLPLLAIAGLLVGFGSVYGNGCTSGHGVCGLARLSPRSLVATATFMATAVITVFLVRHIWGS